MSRIGLKSVFPAALCFFLRTVPTFAGDALFVRPSGTPFAWPNGGRNVPFHTDLGDFGTMSNAAAVAQTLEAFRRWEEIPTATASFVHAGSLDVDVDGSNLFSVEFPPGTNPIIYDDDGSIIEALYGNRSAVFGVTVVTGVIGTGEIIQSTVYLNGCWLEASCVFRGLPIRAPIFLDIQVHELGHFAGLDHSIVNTQLFFGDNVGPTPHDPFPPSPLPERVEVMGGISLAVPLGDHLEPLARGDVPQADDLAIFSTLYPEPDFFASSGTISGRVLSINGRTPLTGVNVIARNVADPIGDAVSAVSGAFVPGLGPKEGPDTLPGAYTLNGLTPGAQYAVYVDEIRAGQFNTPFIQLPGPEEFYNGADESNDPHLDDPSAFTALIAIPGDPWTGIDIVFNYLRPGPISFGRFGPSVQLLLPFPFEMCGQSFDTVFVRSYGDLTFGRSDGAVLPSRFDFLDGPPRIAGFWANPPLNPRAGGLVAFEQTGDTFTVTFTSVPQESPRPPQGPPPPPSGSNTFAITLFASPGGDDGDDDDGDTGSRSRFTVAYGNLSASGGLAGFSCGENFNSRFESRHQESDLSALAGRPIDGTGLTAVFEEFTDGDVDLDNLTLTFELPAFADFEPNDSLAAARRVRLPFRTTESFTAVGPGDVDFYRFYAKAGEILVAETHPITFSNRLDTRLGLFQVTHDDLDGGPASLLASDDDTVSSFSRIIFTVPADGRYVVAVTTHPDFDFVGAGRDFGPYSLTINTYRGRVLPIVDSVQLPLPFRFHFQAADWDHVWVNRTGNLTFGRSDLFAFRFGPPRIAPFFASLAPAGTPRGVTGLVIAEENDESLTIHWVSVPHRTYNNTNTFSATLTEDGDIRMAWEFIDLTTPHAPLVGITEGDGVALPPEADLSTLRRGSASGTTYEVFRPPEDVVEVPLPFDLRFEKLRFVAGRPFILRPYEVAGRGAQAALSYEVKFDYSGAFSAQPHGLTPATTEVATIVDDPENDFFSALKSGVGITAHTFEIPPGTVHARFALFDEHTDGKHDLDLYVFRPDDDFSASTSPISTEKVSFDTPQPGTYTVFVHGYETDGPTATYTLFSWVLGTADGDAGSLAVTAQPNARRGESGAVHVSWAGLQPGMRYLGIITHHARRRPRDHFDENLGHTLLRVDP